MRDPNRSERERAAGAWLRLTAFAGACASALAVASGAAGLHTSHDLISALGLPPLVAVAIAARAVHRRALPAALAALALFLAASASGALLGGGARGVHIALAALAFAAALVSAAATFRGEPAPPAALRDYVALTKPRIMSLLLVTAAAGMFAGAHGVPPLGKLVVLLAGGALASGGASAINHFLDRDIDGLMGGRTAGRPVAAGRLPAPRALEFGLVLSAFSFVLFASLVNVLCAVLALVGNLFYTVVYTSWLKRSTVENIVIGGAAGAVPPLVGWAAATGSLTLPALSLFVIVFVWTPPHFWALALLLKREYAAARVPMLPVVRGDAETARRILAYSLVLAAATALPLLSGATGLVYLVAAALLDATFLVLAWRLRRVTTPRRAALLFHFSLLYLALLFVALAVDPLV